MAVKKTNAMRLLDSAKIEYKVYEYEWSEDDLSGTKVASQIGVPAERVFKTLVAKGDKNGFCVFCIPVGDELDLKKAASESGNKRVELIHVKEILSVTGYIRGGCSPVGMKKVFPTFIDETAILFETVTVSAGIRGCQLEIETDKLVSFTEAKLCPITAD